MTAPTATREPPLCIECLWRFKSRDYCANPSVRQYRTGVARATTVGDCGPTGRYYQPKTEGERG